MGKNGRVSRSLATAGLAAFGYLLCVVSFAAVSPVEDDKVSIREVDGRTEAHVKLNAEASEVNAPTTKKKERAKETAVAVEEGAFDALSTSNKVVARGAEETVEKLRSLSDSAFAWFFRALDIQRPSNSKADSSAKQK